MLGYLDIYLSPCSQTILFALTAASHAWYLAFLQQCYAVMHWFAPAAAVVDRPEFENMSRRCICCLEFVICVFRWLMTS